MYNLVEQFLQCPGMIRSGRIIVIDSSITLEQLSECAGMIRSGRINVIDSAYV